MDYRTKELISRKRSGIPRRISESEKNRLNQHLLEEFLKPELNGNQIRSLVYQGANVDIESDAGMGFRPVHDAAYYDDIEKLKLLKELNADFRAKTDNGDTPLKIAEFWGHEEAVRTIQEFGISE